MSDSKDEPVKPTQPQESEDFGDERISYPTLELYRHTILRGANLGSVVSLIGGPIYLLIRGVRSPKELLRRTGSITAKGTVCCWFCGCMQHRYTCWSVGLCTYLDTPLDRMRWGKTEI